MGNNFKKFIYEDFSGGIDTKSSKIGLCAKENKVFWDDSFNVEIYKNFGVSTMKGNVKVAENTDCEAIFGIAQVEDAKGDYIFVTKSGKISYFSEDSGNIEEIYALEHPPERFLAVRFLNGVLVLTGSNRIVYVKKSTAPSVSEVVIESVKGGEVFGETIAVYASRVWVSEGSTLYFSSLGTYDNWSESENAGYISNFHTSETEIVAMTEYAGKLAVFKADSVYLLSGFTTEDFSISKIGNIGAISSRALVCANNKQFFMNKFGVYALEQFGELAQIGVKTGISENIANEFLNFDKNKIKFSTAIHFEEKNQIWFFCPFKNSVGETTILIYDYYNRAWVKRRIPFEITAIANVNGKVLTGSSNGKIFLENVGNTFSGKPIEFSFSTPFFCFDQPNTPKTIEEVNLILDENFQNSFKFSVSRDWTKSEEFDTDYLKTIFPKTLVFASKNSQDDEKICTWGSAENSEFHWAEPIEEGLRVEVFNTSAAFQLNLRSNEAGDGFGLVGVEFSGISFE